MVEAQGQYARQSSQFLALYTLAWIGGSVAYVPFLTVLLPARVSELAGSSAVDWLAYVSFVGAIAASIANIGFGWLSDRVRNRRAVALAGLFCSSVFLVSLGSVERFSTLLFVIALWQLSLNMMLSPLAAWAGDCVPDLQKGRLGGLLSIAPAVGAIAGIIVTIPGLANSQERLWILALIVTVCVLPAIVFARPHAFPGLMVSSISGGARSRGRIPVSGSVIRMWLARLLIQITEVALFAYLFLWLRSLSDAVSDNATAWVYSTVLLAGIPLAMLAGRWADHRDKPIVPLAACAAVVAVGLLLMGLAENLALALAGYLVFGIGGAVFLALHSAQTLRVLPRPERRGRDLGLFNLTNTIPALIMPWLTLALVPVFGFGGLFFLLSALAIAAFLVLFTMGAQLEG
ncbi:MAG: MFS transporter [Pseudomonadota bacterium]